MMLNIDAAYKAVEILKRDGVLSVDYLGEDDPRSRFVASSCGYSEYGSTAVEATIRLFWTRYPSLSLGLSFIATNDDDSFERKTKMTADDSIYEVYAATKVGPWRALQMREISRADYDFRLSEAQRISEESDGHTDECGWWTDWSVCDCGAHDGEPVTS
jgi:hypothetical protein